MHYSKSYKAKVNNPFLEEEDEKDYEECLVTMDGRDYNPWKLFTRDVSDVLEIKDSQKKLDYNYREYDIYIYDELISPALYSRIFYIMKNTEESDIVHIHLNCPGGDVNTLMAFQAAIEVCQAHIVVHVEGQAYSAAFILAFMGDEIEISEFSMFMCHYVYYTCVNNSLVSIKKSENTMRETYVNLMKKYCGRVLTEQEIDDVCNTGVEIFLTAKEINDRLTKSMSEEEKG